MCLKIFSVLKRHHFTANTGILRPLKKVDEQTIPIAKKFVETEAVLLTHRIVSVLEPSGLHN